MSIPKKLRFEVFKRDSFTCQYCGKKAPDVVLHCDHIEPEAEGGPTTVINLITSCADCNLGKADRRLSDDSVLAKQRAQLEQLQERQEQLEMMVQWQRSLLGLDEKALDEIVRFWCEIAEWWPDGVSEPGRKQLRGALRKFGVEEVMTAMRIAGENYFVRDSAGAPTAESSETAFGKIVGICRTRAAEKDKPYLRDLFYIRGILRNRHSSGDLSYLNERAMMELLDAAFSWTLYDAERMKRIAKEARSWSAWRSDMDEYIDELKRLENG